MKVWILLALTLFIFSGCSTKIQNRQLRAINAKQAEIIKLQQAKINALELKVASKKASKVRRRKVIRKPAKVKKRKLRYTSNVKIPTAPKKHVVLKKVEDSNYSADYMYPKEKKRIPPKAPATTLGTTSSYPAKVKNRATSTAMTKAECISMIGQAKFDKYTQMFGNEAASLKRCKMLKAMK